MDKKDSRNIDKEKPKVQGREGGESARHNNGSDDDGLGPVKADKVVRSKPVSSKWTRQNDGDGVGTLRQVKFLQSKPVSSESTRRNNGDDGGVGLGPVKTDRVLRSKPLRFKPVSSFYESPSVGTNPSSQYISGSLALERSSLSLPEEEEVPKRKRKPSRRSRYPDFGSNSSSGVLSSDTSNRQRDNGSPFSFPCTTESNWPFIHLQETDVISEAYPPSDANQPSMDPANDDQNYNAASYTSESDVEDYLVDDNDMYSTPETDFSLDASINPSKEEMKTSNNNIVSAQPNISGFDTSVSNPPSVSDKTVQEEEGRDPSRISDENQHGLESNKATHQHPPSQFPDPNT